MPCAGGAGEPVRRVLLVDQAKELRLALTPLLRAAGCEVVSVDTWLAARAVLARCRPLGVVADWRALPLEGDGGLGALRGHSPHGDVPLLVVVGEDTPVEVLEVCARLGVEDCVFGPVRAPELHARLEALSARGPRPASRVPEARAARTLLVVGGEAAGGLAGDLEASGHHLLRAPTFERAVALVADLREPPHLVLVHSPLSAAEAMARLERARQGSRLAQVPLVGLSPEVGGWAPRAGVEWWRVPGFSPRQVLARVNTLLQRGRDTLRVDERVPFVCPVEFRVVGTSAWLSGYSSALSPGALFVRTLVPPAPASRWTCASTCPPPARCSRARGSSPGPTPTPPSAPSVPPSAWGCSSSA